MRFCRFDDGRLGWVDPSTPANATSLGTGDTVKDVTAALDALPAYRYPLPTHDVFIANLDAVAARARALAPTTPAKSLDCVKLLSPVANPGKIIAAPVNYEKHLNEVRTDNQLSANNPGHTLTIHKAGLFLKATSSLVGPGQGVAIRRPERRTDHEVELVIIIGRTADRVSRADAMACVAGYTIGLDISIRGSEDRSFRKSADSYSVLGPWMVTADEITRPDALDLQLEVNGTVRQQSNTKHMILSVAELVELASSIYTLHPGDVIFTGTPEGVSPIEAGDRITATIEQIGSMEVVTRAADPVGAPAMTEQARA
jgi:2-keto-4-pentenoate hydratase/2-oxohepta-3-ene-1,7-dioic acid hydratase in catechol pathway